MRTKPDLEALRNRLLTTHQGELFSPRVPAAWYMPLQLGLLEQVRSLRRKSREDRALCRSFARCYGTPAKADSAQLKTDSRQAPNKDSSQARQASLQQGRHICSDSSPSLQLKLKWFRSCNMPTNSLLPWTAWSLISVPIDRIRHLCVCTFCHIHKRT